MYHPNNDKFAKQEANTNSLNVTNANYNLIVPDIILYIALYLDYQSLTAYALINMNNLRILYNEIVKRLTKLELKLVTNTNNTFIIANAGVYGTGFNFAGALGLGDSNTRYYFTPITNLPSNIQKVLAESGNTFFVSNTELYASGANDGVLGLGDRKAKCVPTKVTSIKGRLQQLIITPYQAFMLIDNTLYGCGYNQGGILGVGDNQEYHLLPTKVKGVLEPIQHVVSHHCNTLVLTDTKAYVRHGYTSSSFIEIKRFPGSLLKIHSKGSLSYFITNEGLYVWGSNYIKRIKNNTELHEEVIKIEGILGSILNIEIGVTHAFIQTDKSLYSGGNNDYGQLGHNIAKEVSAFTEIKGFEGSVKQIALGHYHSFLLTDKALYACGDNKYGQLGLGDYRNKRTLTKVTGILGEVQKIITSEAHTFIFTTSGLYACGTCPAGVLGIGDVKQGSTIHNVKVQIALGMISVNAFVPIKNIPNEIKKQWQKYQQCNRLIKASESLKTFGTFAPTILNNQQSSKSLNKVQQTMRI
jgi:alpha-tubulin suppressor-like RCC1 family protein